MDEKPTKSLALPIAAGFLIGTAVYQVIAFLWSQVFSLRRFIEWDWIIKMGDHVRLNCGGCVSVFVVAILAIGVAFGLIKISQK